jgi:hypothetical protein
VQASELSFPVVFHTQNCAVHSGNPTVCSVYLLPPRWHHLKAHPFLGINSADEHRMTYSFSNTISFSTFYASFSSFWITLWPMWLARSKRQPYIHHSHTLKKTHRTDKKTDKPGGKPVLCQRKFSSVVRAVFYKVKLHSLT